MSNLVRRQGPVTSRVERLTRDAFAAVGVELHVERVSLKRGHAVPYGVLQAEHEAAVLEEQARAEAKVVGEIAPRRPDPARGVVSRAYKLPWSLDYQGAVNRHLFIEHVVRPLTQAELEAMGEAMHEGTTPAEFASRIIAREVAAEDRARREEWLEEHNGGAS